MSFYLSKVLQVAVLPAEAAVRVRDNGYSATVMKVIYQNQECAEKSLGFDYCRRLGDAFSWYVPWRTPSCLQAESDLLQQVHRPHRHLNIVTWAGLEGNNLYTEWAGELNFFEYFMTHCTGIISEEDLKLKYFRQMVKAVDHLNSQGILHLDVKLDNFIIDDTRNVIKLCDFGHAAI
jgi:serine/threonine protein kinase